MLLLKIRSDLNRHLWPSSPELTFWFRCEDCKRFILSGSESLLMSLNIIQHHESRNPSQNSCLMYHLACCIHMRHASPFYLSLGEKPWLSHISALCCSVLQCIACCSVLISFSIYYWDYSSQILQLTKDLSPVADRARLSSSGDHWCL